MNQDAHATLPVASSSGSQLSADHAPASRRIFLGPMPYTVREKEHSDSEASEFVSHHGLRIFLQQGGRLEEWTEAKAKEYKERLKERILESAAWLSTTTSNKTRKKKGMIPTVEWRGDTFEIGKVAGVSVNLLAAPEDSIPALQDLRRSSERPVTSKSAAAVHWDNPSSAKSAYFTARSTLTGASQINPGRPALQVTQSAPAGQVLSYISEDSNGENEVDERTSSETPLVSDVISHFMPRGESSQLSKIRDAKSEGDLHRRSRPRLKSILSGPLKDKKKGKAVRYADSPKISSGSRSPVPPEEVLRRSPSQIEDSSAAAVAQTVGSARAVDEPGTENDSEPEVWRDRMLVSVWLCEQDVLKAPFTEKESRVTRGRDNKEWGEFLVIWRRRRIEIYEDYLTPCKERFLGHKHLAFVIPLSEPRTKLSVFSATDMSFCLICPPTPTKLNEGRGRRWIFHRSPRGLNVFVFKHRSRSRAIDWIWNLWMDLDAHVPDHLEIACPLVRARVSMPIPNSGEYGWRVVTRDYVIDQCNKAMEGSFAWQTVVQLPILNGRRMELCWRQDSKLDWVWLKQDIDGRKRDWEVLFGMAMNYLGHPTRLELHLAGHYPSHITPEPGKHLEEPPSIEGYVTYIKRKTQSRVQYYLSTHDGYLFAIPTENVLTPPTPTDIKSFTKDEEEFRKDENVRLRNQIMNSRWFWDLRNVLLVRRATHVDHQVRDTSVQAQLGNVRQLADPDHFDAPEGMQNSQTEEADLRRSASDVEDEGGEEGLAKTPDKGRRKMHRSFELVLKNGRILRFEAHSTKVAVEWVTHLRALVQYWTKRYREDAVTVMEIKENLGEERITVSKRHIKDGSRPPHSCTPDIESASLYLDEFWHWCVLDGCRQIVRSGRVYTKNKLRAQYRHVHLILTRGRLLQFKVKNDFSLHNYQMGRINLVDAYVCSGYYAALALLEAEYDPNAPPLAKYFPDGLETRDVMEDTLFMLWYRPHSTFLRVEQAKGSGGDMNLDKMPIPAMNGTRKVAIFRARSKLERDAWCWALDCEIEKLVRQMREREQRIRSMGTPI